MGAPLVVYNAAPGGVVGHALDARLRIARRDDLVDSPPERTIRALSTFEPQVLWTLLHGLDFLPDPAERDERHAELDTAKDRLANADGLARTYFPGANDLIAMAAEMLDETRDRVLTTARARRDGARNESKRRRADVLRRLRDGLGDSWGHIEVARLILESSTAWRRPPCPTLVREYNGLEIELSNVIRRS